MRNLLFLAIFSFVSFFSTNLLARDTGKRSLLEICSQLHQAEKDTGINFSRQVNYISKFAKTNKCDKEKYPLICNKSYKYVVGEAMVGEKVNFKLSLHEKCSKYKASDYGSYGSRDYEKRGLLKYQAQLAKACEFKKQDIKINAYQNADFNTDTQFCANCKNSSYWLETKKNSNQSSLSQVGKKSTKNKTHVMASSDTSTIQIESTTKGTAYNTKQNCISAIKDKDSSFIKVVESTYTGDIKGKDSMVCAVENYGMFTGAKLHCFPISKESCGIDPLRNKAVAYDIYEQKMLDSDKVEANQREKLANLSDKFLDLDLSKGEPLADEEQWSNFKKRNKKAYRKLASEHKSQCDSLYRDVALLQDRAKANSKRRKGKSANQ